MYVPVFFFFSTRAQRTVASLNFSSQHTVFNHSRYDLEGELTGLPELKRFQRSGQGIFRTVFDAYDAFSDTPMYGTSAPTTVTAQRP